VTAPEIEAAADGLAAFLPFYPLNYPPEGRSRSRTGTSRSQKYPLPGAPGADPASEAPPEIGTATAAGFDEEAK
jgi:hypothetical protein